MLKKVGWLPLWETLRSYSLLGVLVDVIANVNEVAVVLDFAVVFANFVLEEGFVVDVSSNQIRTFVNKVIMSGLDRLSLIRFLDRELVEQYEA